MLCCLTKIRVQYELFAPQSQEQQQQVIYQQEFGSQHQPSLQMQVHQQALLNNSQNVDALRMQQQAINQSNAANPGTPSLLENESLNSPSKQYCDSNLPISISNQQYLQPPPPPTWPPASDHPSMPAPSSMNAYHRFKNQSINSGLIAPLASHNSIQMSQQLSCQSNEKTNRDKLISTNINQNSDVLLSSSQSNVSVTSPVIKDMNAQSSSYDIDTNNKLRDIINKRNNPKQNTFNQQIYANSPSVGSNSENLLASPSSDHSFNQGIQIRSNSLPTASNLESVQDHDACMNISFCPMSRITKSQTQPINQALQMVPVQFSQSHMDESTMQSQMMSSNIQRQYQMTNSCYMDPNQQKYSVNQSPQQYVILESTDPNHMASKLISQNPQQQRIRHGSNQSNPGSVEQACRSHIMSVNVTPGNGNSNINYLSQQNKFNPTQKYQQQEMPQIRSPYRQGTLPQHNVPNQLEIVGLSNISHQNINDECLPLSEPNVGMHMDTRMSPNIMQSPVSPFTHNMQQHQLAHKFQQPSRPISTGLSKSFDLSNCQMYSPRDTHTPQSSQISMQNQGPGTPKSPCGIQNKTSRPLSPSPKASNPSLNLNSHQSSLVNTSSRPNQQQSLSPVATSMSSPAPITLHQSPSPLVIAIECLT